MRSWPARLSHCAERVDRWEPRFSHRDPDSRQGILGLRAIEDRSTQRFVPFGGCTEDQSPLDREVAKDVAFETSPRAAICSTVVSSYPCSANRSSAASSIATRVRSFLTVRSASDVLRSSLVGPLLRQHGHL